MQFLKRFGRQQEAGWLAIKRMPEGIGYAHVVRGDERPRVLRAGFHALPSGDERALAQAARMLQPDRFRCTTYLDPHEYQLLLADEPNVPAEEIKTAIRWRIKDMLEFHVDDATVDVLRIPNTSEVRGRTERIFAVAARSEAVRGAVHGLEAADVRVQAVDIPEIAQRNIGNLIPAGARATGLLSFCSGGALLTIQAGGELLAARRIEPPEGRRAKCRTKISASRSSAPSTISSGNFPPTRWRASGSCPMRAPKCSRRRCRD